MNGLLPIIVTVVLTVLATEGARWVRRRLVDRRAATRFDAAHAEEIREQIAGAFHRRKNVPLETVVKRPYDQWESVEFLLRWEHADYEKPPEQLPSGVWSYTKCELYDIRHDGILVIRGVVDAALNEEGRWAVLDSPRREYDDLSEYAIMRAFHLGLIPYRDIQYVQRYEGDYFAGPVVICRYREAGSPFARDAFALVWDEEDCEALGVASWRLQLDAASRFELQRLPVSSRGRE